MTAVVFVGSPQEEADRGAVHESYRDRLGLLRATYKKPKKGEPPEWHLKTGMLEAARTRITPFGHLLLRYVDVEAADPSTQPG